MKRGFDVKEDRKQRLRVRQLDVMKRIRRTMPPTTKVHREDDTEDFDWKAELARIEIEEQEDASYSSSFSES